MDNIFGAPGASSAPVKKKTVQQQQMPSEDGSPITQPKVSTAIDNPVVKSITAVTSKAEEIATEAPIKKERYRAIPKTAGQKPRVSLNSVNKPVYIIKNDFKKLSSLEKEISFVNMMAEPEDKTDYRVTSSMIIKELIHQFCNEMIKPSDTERLAQNLQSEESIREWVKEFRNQTVK